MTVFVDSWDIIGLAVLAIGIVGFILVCLVMFICDTFEQIRKRIHKNEGDDTNDGC